MLKLAKKLIQCLKNNQNVLRFSNLLIYRIQKQKFKTVVVEEDISLKYGFSLLFYALQMDIKMLKISLGRPEDFAPLVPPRPPANFPIFSKRVVPPKTLINTCHLIMSQYSSIITKFKSFLYQILVFYVTGLTDV